MSSISDLSQMQSTRARAKLQAAWHLGWLTSVKMMACTYGFLVWQEPHKQDSLQFKGTLSTARLTHGEPRLVHEKGPSKERKGPRSTVGSAILEVLVKGLILCFPGFTVEFKNDCVLGL